MPNCSPVRTDTGTCATSGVSGRSSCSTSQRRTAPAQTRDDDVVARRACSPRGSIWPALEHCLKCSHLFNILDSSGSIGVTERTAYILRVRQLAVRIAKAYVEREPAPERAAGARGRSAWIASC